MKLRFQQFIVLFLITITAVAAGVRSNKKSRKQARKPNTELASGASTPTPINVVAPASLATPTDCVSCLLDGTLCPESCCTANWYPCSASARCCDGWECVSWENRNRCEPSCVANWYPCDEQSTCCDGWHCVDWTYGKRCEQ